MNCFIKQNSNTMEKRKNYHKGQSLLLSGKKLILTLLGVFYFFLSCQKNNYFDLGKSEYDKGNFENAIINFTKAIELKPDYAEAYYNRGNAYVKLQQYGKAIYDFNKAIELKQDDAQAYYNRGLVYYFSGNTYKACKDWREASLLGYYDAKKLLDEYCK